MQVTKTIACCCVQHDQVASVDRTLLRCRMYSGLHRRTHKMLMATVPSGNRFVLYLNLL